MRSRFQQLAVTLLCALLLGHCGDVDVSAVGNPTDAGASGNGSNIDPKTLRLETEILGDARAGLAFEVKCRTCAPVGENVDASGGYGEEVPLPAPATVLVVAAAAPPIAVQGTKVFLRQKGQYQVACKIASIPLQDPTPANLLVVAGPAQTVDTRIIGAVGKPPPALPPMEVIAGVPLDVTCMAADQFGNPIDTGFSLLLDPPQTQAPQGMVVALTSAGLHKISCLVQSVVDASPAEITVIADVPRHLFTLLEPETIVAGNAAKLGCVANDAYGNAIANFPFALDYDKSIEIKGLYATSTAAGLHKIQCVPESLAWDLFTLHPKTLHVNPAAPFALDVSPVPNKQVYKNSEKVQFITAVRDEFGNLIPDAVVDLSVLSPAKGYKAKSADTILFAADATYKVHAEVKGSPDVFKDLNILVDGTPPKLSIDYPPWGSTLTGKPSVQIAGTVGDDGSGIQTLKVAKTHVFFDPVLQNAYTQSAPCGSAADCKDGGVCILEGNSPHCSLTPWLSQEAARHGLNAIRAEATDLGKQITKATRGFYYAGKFYPTDAKTPKGALVPDGMQVFLGKDFIDDGVHDPTHPDDLATIMEVALAGMDLNALIPANINAGGTEIKLSNLKIGKPHISLAPIAGGMTMKIEIPNMYTDIDVKNKTKLGPISITTSVSGYITIDKIVIDTVFKMSVKDGVAQVAVEKSKVNLQNFKLHVDGLLGLFDFLFNLILKSYVSQLEGQMSATLSSTIPPVLAGILNQFAINQVVPLPPLFPGQPGATVALVSQVHSLEFTAAGGLIKMDASFVAQKGTTHSILGAIGRAGCLDGKIDVFQIDQAQRLSFALHDDLINQLIYAIWYAGALKLTGMTAEQLGLVKPGVPPPGGMSLEGAKFGMDFFLPPILETCAQPTANDLRLQIGDLLAQVTIMLGDTPIDFSMFFSFDLGATMGLVVGTDGVQQLQIAIGKEPKYQVELVSISKDFADMQASFETLIKAQFDAAMVKGIPGLDKLNVALPQLDLGAVLPGLPPGTKITLKIKDLLRGGGYTAFNAQLQ